jgi:hypothetical protein
MTCLDKLPEKLRESKLKSLVFLRSTLNSHIRLARSASVFQAVSQTLGRVSEDI